MPLFALAMPGLPEMLIVLVIVLILFGAGRLPQVFESFGKGIKSFKDAQKDADPVDVTPPKTIPDKGQGVSEANEVKEKVGP
jgi:sec-independent protein translocase protein TatA